MKKIFTYLTLVLLVVSAGFFLINNEDQVPKPIEDHSVVKTTKKTPDERRLNAEERLLHEYNLQKNPLTGLIPEEERELELQNAMIAKELATSTRATTSVYVSRGPSNLGGRTRAFVVDITDNTSNTILAGGVSSGLFRTTNGGADWTKVSPSDDIHNVTALAQDPRAGFENIWYYGTGEWRGNSASLGSPYRGRGVWRSTDSGLTWTQIPGTDSAFDAFDSFFDYINNLAVSPINGDLLIAATGKIYRYDGTNLIVELEEPASGVGFTDVIFTSSGVAYASIEGSSSANGVYTSPTGNGSWTNIASNGSPAGWSANNRIVLASAPSNNDIVYALFDNGSSGGGTIEADLWQYNAGTTTWTDYSSKMPDEAGGDLPGNDPFAHQGSYDLVVDVRPNDENFVVIGGTNAYKISDITTAPTFLRIGGYASNSSYALYSAGGDTHHPDIHQLKFDPNNDGILFSGTDGGVHRTDNIDAPTVTWTSLNNNYQTYQFYHVALDPQMGSNIVLGGTQDNGTVVGGTDNGLPDNTTMTSVFGGDGVSAGLARRDGGTVVQPYFGTQNGPAYTTYPNFRSIRPAGSNSQFVTYFYLDIHNPNALYYAGLTNLYRTNNAETVTTAVNASNWSNLGPLPIAQNLRTFATSPGAYSASSYLLVGGQNGRIYRMDDPQNQTSLFSSAVEITPAGASTAAGSVVSAFGVHPTNPDIVLACYANYGITNIYYTTNATAATPTWTLVERNLSSHSIRSAAIADLGSETIFFVGTARGLYSTTDPENVDWDLESPNEVGLAVVSGLVFRASDNTLLIGTHGNGMYETVVQGTLSTDDVTLDDTALSVYPNPAQADLNFRGANSVILDNVKYEIYNLSGQQVENGVISEKKIDVSKLQAGMYFVNVTVNGSKESLRFIKQ